MVAMSGGIDSSALAVTIAEYNKDPLSCFTAIFKNQSINEEHFADVVANKINAKHFKVEPTLNGFLEEVDVVGSKEFIRFIQRVVKKNT